jgi:succinate dehydrogenase / fumarate reductase flavoprotein subunit
VALEIATGSPHVFRAKAVLFATGGFGRMFRVTSNAFANTGDGPAVLARRGVPLEDMEFFQFHPTGLRGLGILITEGVRGEGGVLRNRMNERFMEKYSPRLLDLAPRDIVARAIVTEMREGRGVKGDGSADDYVWLDARGMGKETLEAKLPEITGFCRTYLGVDPAAEPIPVLPTAHYAMGGVPTDEDGRVRANAATDSTKGCTPRANASLVHGANRLGRNSLVDLVVFAGGRATT